MARCLLLVLAAPALGLLVPNPQAMGVNRVKLTRVSASTMEPPTKTKKVATTSSSSSATATSRLEAATSIKKRNKEEEALAEEIASSLVDESCDVTAPDPACADETQLKSLRSRLKGLVLSVERKKAPAKSETVVEELGDALEAGWEAQGKRSSLRRNLAVWRKLATCAFKVLKAKTSEQKTAAAVFARDSLLTLGPTFVKLGQVLSTRTDVVPKEYIDVLKSLQDDVPAFSGQRAAEIVARELGVSDVSEIFDEFSETPLAAASLGQVHTARLKDANRTKVAIKVQRAGLKELFDVDLKNLRKLCELLDKVDPKSDGADRSYIDVFDESEKLLYEEIDYLNEAENTRRFAADFNAWTSASSSSEEESEEAGSKQTKKKKESSSFSKYRVRVPTVFDELTTPRVLTMEFVESFKLTDLKNVDKNSLDRKELAKRCAESFLYQIIDTGYFHCDPHPGNLATDSSGRLVYYDYGMMDELKPNVRRGFKKFCFALFEGGPMVSDLELAARAKELVDAVEEMGVLAKGADRISCEQLARYFIRAFKDAQLGKKNSQGNIKTTLGAELQQLTESQVFRFPSTFTFIFRAVASIEGIGKTLDPDYDLAKLAQPFVEKLIDSERSPFDTAAKATGLNFKDINTAVTTPRKIAYLEETVRSMETGALKIRVRSIENELALSRLSAQNKATSSFVIASLALNLALIAGRETAKGVPQLAATIVAAACTFRGLKALGALAAMDKKNAKYSSTKQFTSEDD